MKSRAVIEVVCESAPEMKEVSTVFNLRPDEWAKKGEHVVAYLPYTTENRLLMASVIRSLTKI